MPNDLQAWIYLARGYMGAGDAGDAAKAYARAVTLANRSGHPDASLDVLYGEALVAQANGEVARKRKAAFRAALKLNPKDQAARFFLGQALAAHGDKAGGAGAVEQPCWRTPGQFAAASDAGGPHRHADRAGRAAAHPIPRRWWRDWRRG